MTGLEYTPLNIIDLIFCLVMIFCMGLMIDADKTTRSIAKKIYFLSIAVVWVINIIR